jgi:hypothetical protein
MRKVKLDAIRIDGGTQCRLVIDQPTVYNYLESMKEGDEFPLIETVFDGSTYWLTDGFHRYHAFKLLGIKEIEVKYKPGTLMDAKLEALKANSKHGKPLSNEDKRNKVRMALEIEGFDKKSDREIAKLCEVSVSFVSSIRRPEIKIKQSKNVTKHYKNKTDNEGVVELHPKPDANDKNTTPRENTEKIPDSGQNPDEAEMQATELAMQADQEAMYKLLESDEPLKIAYEEIKRLNYLIAQQETRIHGLMNERNTAVSMLKKLQKESDKLKAKK